MEIYSVSTTKFRIKNKLVDIEKNGSNFDLNDLKRKISKKQSYYSCPFVWKSRKYKRYKEIS